jgi:hypothetical protein
MKPPAETGRPSKHGDSSPAHRSRAFPLLHWNYQQSLFGRYGGGHAGRSKSSILAISRDYFRAEARWSYLVEVFFFALIVATAGSAVIYGAGVIIRLLGLPGPD